MSSTQPKQFDSSSATRVLADIFGYQDFRFGQADAVSAVIAGRDALVLLPTGAGKSLCYQVPAIVMSAAGQGTTIVISPLIALMKDQVDALNGRGVAVGALNSQQDDDAQADVVKRFLAGELTMLYVSPERAALSGFRKLLGRTKIAMLAIDEAHCLSQWGHDFRPEYMQLHELRELPALRGKPTIALTATATPRVLDEISSALRLVMPATIRGDFTRPNLRFAVLHCSRDNERIAALVDACETAGLRSRVGGGRAVVYCSTRKKAETVAAALTKAGFAAGHYHAGRTALARDRAQRGFAVGRTKILVATNAFGMGIDLPDVRLIVHFQAPGSLEAYYQEAGRAGRDGSAAGCVLLFGAADLMTQRRLQQGKSGASELRAEQALAAILKYATTVACRQKMICEHFTGEDHHSSCGTCDVCLDVDQVQSAAGARSLKRQADADQLAIAVAALPDDVVTTILAMAEAMPKPVGKMTMAKALRGSTAKTVVTSGLLRLPQFATLHAHSEEAIAGVIDNLLSSRKLVRRGQKYPTVWLAGRAVSDRAGDGSGRGARTTNRRSSSSTSRTAGNGAGAIARELESYRRKKARELKWKAFMIFQRKTMLAIDKQRPLTRDALSKIPGLGPAKIDRFGSDIIDVVKRNS
jgi:ATP-dependent DNA helicase RecQ